LKETGDNHEADISDWRFHRVTTAYNTNLSVSAFSTPDPVYEVSTPGGAVSKLIYATAPPEVGHDHLWGAEWMIFYTPPSFLLPVFP
jgi:hypothetical protein